LRGYVLSGVSGKSKEKGRSRSLESKASAARKAAKYCATLKTLGEKAALGGGGGGQIAVLRKFL